MSARTKKPYIIISIIIVVIIAIIIIAISLFNNHPVKLPDSDYGVSEFVEITSSDYEKMIAEKQTFVLMIDNVGCSTAERLRHMLANFSDSLKFKYYKIMWPDAKTTNLAEHIKYFPSIVIIENGELKSYLDPESDDDTKYYHNAPDLQKWLESYIIFK